MFDPWPECCIPCAECSRRLCIDGGGFLEQPCEHEVPLCDGCCAREHGSDAA